jgi:hypothetical protein
VEIGLARLQLLAPLRGFVGLADGLVELHEACEGRLLEGKKLGVSSFNKEKMN